MQTPERVESGRVQRPDAVASVASLIIAADQLRRGASTDAPLPTDATARLIATYALGETAPQNHQPVLSSTAKMIVNADRARRGEDISEAE